MKKGIKGLLASLALVFLTTTGVANAEESVVNRETNVTETTRSGGGSGDSGSGITGRVADKAKTEGSSASDQGARNLVKANREAANNYSKGLAGSTQTLTDQVTKQATITGNPDGSTPSGLADVGTRANSVIDEGGTVALSLALKLLFWGSVIAIAVGLLMMIGSFFFKALKLGRGLMLVIAGSLFFGIIIGISDYSLLDNPVVDLFVWVFTGK